MGALGTSPSSAKIMLRARIWLALNVLGSTLFRAAVR